MTTSAHVEPYFSRWMVYKGLARLVVMVLSRGVAYAVLMLFSRLTGWIPSWDDRSVTPAALTTALRTKSLLGKSGRVVALEWSEIECGAVGIVYRVHITYESADEAATSIAPKTVIVKVLGRQAKHMLLGVAFGLTRAEFISWTDIRTLCATDLQPDLYVMACSMFFMKGFIVMEDLARFRSKKSRSASATVPEVKMMMRAVATLHGRTWGDAARCAKFMSGSSWFDHLYPRQLNSALGSCLGDVLAKRCPTVSRLLEELRDPVALDRVHRWSRGFGLNENMSDCKDWRSLAMCHLDVRLDNAFFDDSTDTCHLVDWQLCRFKNPIIDTFWCLLDLDREHLGDTEILRDLFASYVADVNRALPAGRKPPASVASIEGDMPHAVGYMAIFMVAIFATVLKDPRKCPAEDGEALEAYSQLPGLSPVVLTMRERALRLETLAKAFCVVGGGDG
eukprot:PhM_4_TR8209/c0_g1_i1/m.2781